MNHIINAISSVGFPIAAACGMFWLYNKTITNLTETLTKMNAVLDDLKDEILKERNDK